MTPQPARWAARGDPHMPGSGHDASPPPLSLIPNHHPPPGALAPDGADAAPLAPLSPPPGCPGPAGPPIVAQELPAKADLVPTASAAFAIWTLADGRRSPGIAREYAASALRGWGLDELVDSIAVSVSEMVTNAMCHTTESAGEEGDQPVLLSLAKQARSVLCVVVDPGCSAPEVRDLDDDAESGRGLHIVECLSNEWGWTVPGPAGKAVWATFSCADSESHEHCRRARGETLSRVLLLAGILGGTEARPSEPHAVHAQRTRGQG